MARTLLPGLLSHGSLGHVACTLAQQKMKGAVGKERQAALAKHPNTRLPRCS